MGVNVQDFVPLAIGLVIVIAVLAILGAYFAKAARRKALGEWAAGRGLSFHPGREEDMDDRFADFPCLQEGDDRYAENLIDGAWDQREFLAFDYHYTTGSGDDKKEHRITVVVLGSAVSLKDLLIRQEKFSDKLSAFFGFDDIDFESAQFSREFYVKSSDRKWAYDVLHARAMQLLMASPRFSIQMSGRRVMAWRPNRLEPYDIEAAAVLVAGLLDGMPEYLIRQQADSWGRS